MKALIVINEAHTIMPRQRELLDARFADWDTLLVPKEGWTLAKMREDIIPPLQKALLTGTDVVFVSPVPVLLKELSFFEGALYDSEAYSTGTVRVMMRDQRIKAETKDGVITSKIDGDAWRLA